MTAISAFKDALTGLTVLDLTRLLPGAFCTQMLADLGAEVIKVEEPGRGDYNREFPPLNVKESGSFLLLNRNKKSITVNLKTEEGKTVLRRLAARADILVEGFRPGVMDRLGMGYETLAAENPRLIYCAISGFGQDGPYAKTPGHDLNYMALAGALQLFGKAGEGPIVPGLSIADQGGGSLMAAFGILAAVLARGQTGKGQFVDVSMTDGLVAWLPYHAADYFFAGVEPKGGERRFLGQAPCYNVFRCADGRHITLGLIEETFWNRFCDLVGLSDLKEAQWPEGAEAEAQMRRVADLMATKTCDEWMGLLGPADLPVAPVNTMREAFDDPQLKHREMLLEMEHPVEGRIPQLGFPIKFSDTPGRLRTPPPLLGEHNDEVLRSLGYTADDIADMRRKSAI
ncbi:CaiB/BaiF CoA transferase family protein [Azospirillum soli]|uniref:CaiB/BaiF CoA transferase family protein n=1 Tax=Azospirillum soli TaxID=1304799 RepID=UPI001AE58D93|nr:CaiB/BaiF CoA-transferase family protein [Azospirillum soli]MBP2316654.1 crotonobetainyl-CoA:carnitine CoA-transferase CaiB-like acyl-CoA transferase [Azospirillum soli]